MNVIGVYVEKKVGMGGGGRGVEQKKPFKTNAWNLLCITYSDLSEFGQTERPVCVVQM